MLVLAMYKCLSQWPPPYMCNVICYIDSGDALILISNWYKSFLKYMIPILAMYEKKKKKHCTNTRTSPIYSSKVDTCTTMLKRFIHDSSG
jgi:hypothetical protein